MTLTNKMYRTPIHLYYLLIFISFFLSTHSTHADSFSDEPFVVKLSTESPLEPLYLLPFGSDDSDLSSSYIRQLQDLLEFDLSHNGSTIAVANTPSNDRIGTNGPFDQLGSISTWKEQHIFYVVKVEVRGRSLAALVLNTQKENMKSVENLPLTGVLDQDRKQVHCLADIIHKALFDIDGIACTRILFTVQIKPTNDSSKWIAEVWECDYDGGNLKQITGEGSTCLTPTYVPPKPGYAAGAFLYVSYHSGTPKIYLSSLKNGKGQRLLSLKGNQFMPAVSAQRDKIAFISDITGNPDLFLQPFSMETGAIGKPQQIFSAKLAAQGSPTFSPDGKHIAFVSNKDGSPKIYMITIPQPGATLQNIRTTLISKSNRENSSPAWSPDGTMIAYCAKNSGDRQIWIYDFKTGQEKQVTQGSGQKENPSWAPNNLYLVYNTADKNSNELFITSIHQGVPTQISSGRGEKRFPNWEPRNFL